MATIQENFGFHYLPKLYIGFNCVKIMVNLWFTNKCNSSTAFAQLLFTDLLVTTLTAKNMHEKKRTFLFSTGALLSLVNK